METTLALLRTHVGRDKVLRAIYFACCLLESVTVGSKFATRVANFASGAARTRSFMRLLDNLPMLHLTLSYGLGKRTEPLLYRLFQVLENISYQLYYPAEHMALLKQLNVLSPENSYPWALISLIIWAAGLFSGITKNTVMLYSLNCRYEQALKEREVSGEDSGSEGERLRQLRQEQKRRLLTLLRDACDFTNAVHWLPASYWSGKLTAVQSASLGLVSSAIFLSQCLSARK